MGLSETGLPIKNFKPGLTRSERLKPLALEPSHSTPQIEGPGPVLLLGAPGVGKGTQADTLAKLWGIPKISTGDILRANVSNGTVLGVHANRIMKLGQLVPDRIMTEMVADRLSQDDTETGYILDGFPRTVQQAKWLDGYLGDRLGGSPLAIVSMCMDFGKIAERVIHRRVCPLCKAIYNIQLMPPKRVGRCDKDGSELEQRSDDGPEVFRTRLDVFKQETEPLIQYYRNRSLFMEIDGDRPPSLITEAIFAGIIDFRIRRSGCDSSCQ